MRSSLHVHSRKDTFHWRGWCNKWRKATFHQLSSSWSGATEATCWIYLHPRFSAVFGCRQCSRLCVGDRPIGITIIAGVQCKFTQCSFVYISNLSDHCPVSCLPSPWLTLTIVVNSSLGGRSLESEDPLLICHGHKPLATVQLLIQTLGMGPWITITYGQKLKWEMNTIHRSVQFWVAPFLSRSAEHPIWYHHWSPLVPLSLSIYTLIHCRKTPAHPVPNSFGFMLGLFSEKHKQYYYICATQSTTCPTDLLVISTVVKVSTCTTS